MEKESRLILLEFDSDMKPFAAVYDDDGYYEYFDIDYFRKSDMLYYHKSGGGGKCLNVYREHKYWAANRITVMANDDQGEEILALKENLIAIPEKYSGPIDDWACDGETVWCTVCQDNLPNDDICRHLFWSKSRRWWAGTGDSDGDRWIKEIKESVFSVLNKSKLADVIEKAIAKNNFKLEWSGTIFGYDRVDFWFDGQRYGDEFTDDLTDEEEEAMSDGMGWLNGLDENAVEARKLTIEWINEYNRKAA